MAIMGAYGRICWRVYCILRYWLAGSRDVLLARLLVKHCDGGFEAKYLSDCPQIYHTILLFTVICTHNLVCLRFAWKLVGAFADFVGLFAHEYVLTFMYPYVFCGIAFMLTILSSLQNAV